MGLKRGLRYERDRRSKMTTILVISGPMSEPKSELLERVVRHLAPKYIATLKIAEGDVARDQSGVDEQSWEMCPCCASEEQLLSTIYTIRSTINPDVLLIDLEAEGSLATVLQRLKYLPAVEFQIMPSVLVTNTTGIENGLLSDNNSSAFLAAGAILHFPHQSEQRARTLAAYGLGSANIFEHVDDFTAILDEWQTALDISAKKTETADPKSEAEDYFLLESPRCDSLANLFDFAGLILRYRFGCVTAFHGVIRYGDQHAILDIVDSQFTITGADAIQGSATVVRGVNVDIESLAAYLLTTCRPTLRQHLPNQLDSLGGYRM